MAGTSTLPLVAGGRAVPGEGEAQVRRTFRQITIAAWIAGVSGAIDVFVLLFWVLPGPETASDRTTIALVNLAALAGYLVVTAPLGTWWARRTFLPATRWLAEGRPPTESERDAVLRQPLFCAGQDALAWGFGAALFFAINLPAGTSFAAHVATTILLGGITVTALGYLLVERLMRPITTRALVAGPAMAPRGPGVATRLLLAWAVGTGVPLAGLALLGAHLLVDPGDTTAGEAARSIVVLAAIAALAGLFATWLVARSVADPLMSVRRALRRIEDGDLGARVEVDDASEVGQLQTGFNRMATGLSERERLRDLFGRHVGEDVARAALDRDGPLELGGEVRDVAVLFVDLVGSTAMASRRAPRDVVRLLNDFFAVVVDVTGRHGGWVNKFEGDAALVVFGAPADHDDAAGAALRAARELRRRLHVLPGVDAGIGVSAGPAVAGNVGAEHRFEYTVIGDPVNEAARLCELAKRHDRRLLASGAVLRAAGDEAAHWSTEDEVVLRGRSRPTRLATPA